MKKYLLLIILISTIRLTSQTIKEREDKIFNAIDYNSAMKEVHSLLKVDQYNEIAIEELLRDYYFSEKKDSISFFFDNLIRKNPNKIKPYLLKIEFSDFENLNENNKLKYLNKAYKIDSINETINLHLAINNYSLFVKSSTNNPKRAKETASKALKFFMKVYSIGNDELNDMIELPIVQISNYLAKLNIKYQSKPFHLSYFPLDSFSNLPKGWETNYSINVYEFIEYSIFSIKWYSEQLQALKEPKISIIKNAEVYRFTWLRTFNNPISVRVEKKENKETLNWKVCDGAGGYKPGKLIINKSRELADSEWNGFIKKLNELDFWSLKTKDDKLTGFDGSQWILEGNKEGNYHVVDRWIGQDINSVCMYLLNLTDIKIDDDDKY